MEPGEAPAEEDIMAKRKLLPEDIEKRIHKYLSRHIRTRFGEEAYDFNIKMLMRIEIPDLVLPAKGWSQSELNDFVETLMVDQLKEFADELKNSYPWIKNWFQEGRTGGWLVLVTDEPVLNEYGKISESGDPRERSEFLSAARKRLKDLETIETKVDDAKAALVRDLESPEWWDIGPKEWRPARSRLRRT